MKITKKNLSDFPDSSSFLNQDSEMIDQIDFEKDSVSYLAKRRKEEKKKKDEEQKKNPKKEKDEDSDKPQPDPLGMFGENFSVLPDGKTKFFDVLMTRCDLSDGLYGTYLFYKL